MRPAIVVLSLLSLLPLFADDPPTAASDDPRIEEAIQKGVAFLVAKRDERGFWRSDATKACRTEGYTAATSALACLAFLEARHVAQDKGAPPAHPGNLDWLKTWAGQAARRNLLSRED